MVTDTGGPRIRGALLVRSAPTGETVAPIAGGDVGQRRSVVLPRLPSSARAARTAVLGVLEAAGRHGGPHAGITELLVSELATNAIRYGTGADFRVEVEVEGAAVRVSVHDHNPVVPQPRRVSPGAQGGRGLHLVQVLARTWGADPAADGKVVWFVVDAGDDGHPGGWGSPAERL